MLYPFDVEKKKGRSFSNSHDEKEMELRWGRKGRKRRKVP